MKDVLKNIGVFTVTGVMAVIGLTLGMVTFRPENISFKNNDFEKESK